MLASTPAIQLCRIIRFNFHACTDVCLRLENKAETMTKVSSMFHRESPLLIAAAVFFHLVGFVGLELKNWELGIITVFTKS